MSLFKSDNVNDWKVIYSKRDEYVMKKQHKALESLRKSKRKNKEELIKNMKLVEFDNYLFNELHKKIKNRNQNNNDDYMTLDELSIVMKWKLFRGQFRPRLQTLIDSNNNKEVIKCTKNAFKIIKIAINKEQTNINDINKLKLSIKTLNNLKGVGVATASLILAIYTKNIPFMADESMLAVSPGLSLKYDMKTYLNYVAKLVEKCKILNEDWNSDDENKNDFDDDFIVTPFVVGECLWTDYISKKFGDKIHVKENELSEKKKKGKKRKAEHDMLVSKPAKKRKVCD
eukprot:495204_1